MKKTLLRVHVLVALTCLCACSREPRRGSLAEYAHGAKLKGEQSVTFNLLHEAQDDALSGFLRIYSTVIGSPTRAAVAQTVAESAIYTWNVFHIERVLAKGSRHDMPGCRIPQPRGVQLKPNDVLVARSGGSTEIHGVTVTMKSSEWVPDDSERRYVLCAVLCREDRMILPLYGEEVFEITSSGQIVSAVGARFGYQKEMERFGTVGELEKYLVWR